MVLQLDGLIQSIRIARGTGFDVVPTDCLAKTLAEALPDSEDLKLAFWSNGEVSRGTMKTMIENAGSGGAARRDGKIIKIPAASQTITLDFPGGPRSCASIPWGDVSTAFYTTHIPNITVYMSMSPKQQKMNRMSERFKFFFSNPMVIKFMTSQVDKKITGPQKNKRDKSWCYLWGRTTKGSQYREAVLKTPDGYELTALLASHIIKDLYEGKELPAGFLTPSQAFGKDIINQIPGVEPIRVLDEGQSWLTDR